MIQYRRIGALVLGAWLGIGIAADIAVIQNFESVDRFLEVPGSVRARTELNRIGHDRERAILRRNAGEENNWIFLNWERVELVIAPLLFFLLLFGARPQKLELGFCAAMLGIIVGQHFFLDSRIAELGRRIDDLPAGDPETATFWTLHGFYSGLEILKLAIGLAFATRLAAAQKLRTVRSASETDPQPVDSGKAGRRRTRELRRLRERNG